MSEIESKVCIVTGANSGIGKKQPRPWLARSRQSSWSCGTKNATKGPKKKSSKEREKFD